MKRLIFSLATSLILLGGCAETAPTESEEGADDTTPIVTAEPYDFEAAAPWFECPTADFPPEATVVPALEQAYQRFVGENTRDVQADVTFPETGSWAQIGMLVRLECPESGLCDHWDRTASVAMIANPDAPAEEHEHIELARFITPYRIEMCQYIDVTSMAPLLKGNKTITSWIDTWVGEGHSNGEGWRTSVSFVFYPGTDVRPTEIVNVWSRRTINVGNTDAEGSVASQLDTFNFTLPDTPIRKVEAHLTTTGHGFGYTYNCAEFCQMRHDIVVNGELYSSNPWRDDCDQNPVSPQYGTWEYGRNGWCPGAISVGERIDITRHVVAGENTLDFDILLPNGTEYANTISGDSQPHTVASLKLYLWY